MYNPFYLSWCLGSPATLVDGDEVWVGWLSGVACWSRAQVAICYITTETWPYDDDSARLGGTDCRSPRETWDIGPEDAEDAVGGVSGETERLQVDTKGEVVLPVLANWTAGRTKANTTELA